MCSSGPQSPSSQWPGQPACVLNGGAIDPVITVLDPGLNVTTQWAHDQNGLAGAGLTFNGAAGITESGSTVTVANSVIEEQPTGAGATTLVSGGIAVEGSRSPSTIRLSRATRPSTAVVGGLYNVDGTVAVTTRPSRTTAPSMAAASSPVVARPTPSTLDNSTVADNAAQARRRDPRRGTLTVTDSTLSANSAPAGQGAGILDSGGGATTLAGHVLATPGGAPAGAECAGGSFSDGGYDVDNDGTCGLSATNHSVSGSATIRDFLGVRQATASPARDSASLPGNGHPPKRRSPPLSPHPRADHARLLAGRPARHRRGAPCDMGSLPSPSPSRRHHRTSRRRLHRRGLRALHGHHHQLPHAHLSEAGGLPTGVTFVDNANGTATLSGTPGSGTGGTYPIAVAAANGTSPDAVQRLHLAAVAVHSFVGGSYLAAAPDGLGYWYPPGRPERSLPTARPVTTAPWPASHSMLRS